MQSDAMPSCSHITWSLDLQGCGAVATDSTGQDISSSLLIVDVTPCGTGSYCPACDITFAAEGLCPPGSYLYVYRYLCSHNYASNP